MTKDPARATKKPEVIVCPDPPAVARFAAKSLANLALRAAASNRRLSVVLSGGSTPRLLYELLASPKAPRVDWSRIDLFWGDERCVGPDHPESNYGMAKRLLLDQVAVPSENVHRMRGELPAEEAARQYEKLLGRHFGLSDAKMPDFDLVFLGLGGDGHTASLFPKSAVLREQTRAVAASFVEKVGGHRITLTLPVLNNSHSVTFLVTGASKARILSEVLQPAGPREMLPASLIQPRGKLSYLVDRAAAQLLEERGS